MYIKYDKVKKDNCWRITFATTSLTTNPPTSTKGNLKGWQIVNVISVLEYSNIDVYLVQIEKK